jgi:hypothetical protein
MVPDAIKHCKKVIVDCDLRLANLFSRSFPDAAVYGTRKAKPKDGSKWRLEDRQFDASLAMGQIGEYFRTADKDFQRKPYLVPDPNRVLMWKSLWATKNKPIIGIAWSGGIPKTGAQFRRFELDEWAPLFKAIDAHYVSLQYKPAAPEIEAFRAHGVDLVEYPYATLTSDYDDTAALVASLDCVVGVPTAVIHLAGALGVPTFALCARMKCWKYNSGNPFQPVTNIEWAGSWKNTISAAVPNIEELCLKSSSDLTLDNLLPTTRSNSQSPNIAASPLQ